MDLLGSTFPCRPCIVSARISRRGVDSVMWPYVIADAVGHDSNKVRPVVGQGEIHVIIFKIREVEQL